MRYSFIKNHYGQFPILAMCKVLEVSASGYYHWLGRPLSVRALRHKVILAAIKEIHKGVRRAYGYRRVYKELAADESFFKSLKSELVDWRHYQN